MLFQPQEVAAGTVGVVGARAAVGLLAVAQGVPQALALAVVEELMAVRGVLVALPGAPAADVTGRDQVGEEKQQT